MASGRVPRDGRVPTDAVFATFPSVNRPRNAPPGANVTDDFTIRRYQPPDANAVWRVHERAFAAASIPFDPELDRDLRRIPEAYLDGGEFLVGAVEGRVVAIGGFQPIDRVTVGITRMRVDLRYQRRGYGSALLEALEARARDRGFEQAALQTSERLEPARAFYGRYGYDEIERGTHTEVNFDLARFRKSLSP